MGLFTYILFLWILSELNAPIWCYLLAWGSFIQRFIAWTYEVLPKEGRMNLITRKDTIEYLMTNTNWHDEDGYTVEDADEKRAIITDLINGIPDADPGWISVEDRLPEEEQVVLICNKSGDIWIASGSYSTEIDEWIWYLDSWRVGPVVAWRPLPPAFKPKEDK